MLWPEGTNSSKLVAEIANSSEHTVTLNLTKEDLSGHGGAVTRSDRATRESNIKINEGQVSGLRVLGTLRTSPLQGWTYITGVSRSAAIFHELGHAVAPIRGKVNGDPGLAIHYENTFRYLSNDIAYRKSHSHKDAFWVPVR